MSKRILVVDDLATQRAAAAYTLTGAGYEIFQAENGEDAIYQMEVLGGVHLVIADLSMPVKDGLSLLKTLKQNLQFRSIPVLMLLTESQIPRKEELRQEGAAGWILKPYQPEQLFSIVSKLIS
ncbi:MAG: response regulator [SAR324 cluster bacterium]|nr:response regulator [SAR324 cluster bacterium]